MYGFYAWAHPFMHCVSIHYYFTNLLLTFYITNIFNLSDGEIILTLENEIDTFVIKTRDNRPVRVNYISFGATENSLGSPVEFFYNNHEIPEPLKSFETSELLDKCKYVHASASAGHESFSKLVQNVTEVNGTIRVPVMLNTKRAVFVSLCNTSDRKDENATCVSIGN